MTSKYQVYNLEGTYPELGEYGFKVVLNPKKYKSAQNFNVLMVDSDGKKMDFVYQIWGRKINVQFRIHPNTSDGVSIVKLMDGADGPEVGRLTFWVIKP